VCGTPNHLVVVCQIQRHTTVLRNGYIYFSTKERTKQGSPNPNPNPMPGTKHRLPFRPLCCGFATFPKWQVPPNQDTSLASLPRRPLVDSHCRDGRHARTGPRRLRFAIPQLSPIPRSSRPATHTHFLASGSLALARSAPMPQQHTQHDRWIIPFGARWWHGGDPGLNTSAKMATTPAVLAPPHTVEWSYKRDHKLILALILAQCQWSSAQMHAQTA
jgi:hypothetical protein